MGMAKHDTGVSIENSDTDLGDLELEVTQILMSMDTGASEKHTLFASPERVEIIESLRYPESINESCI
jgi:hypothetical protein